MLIGMVGIFMILNGVHLYLVEYPFASISNGLISIWKPLLCQQVFILNALTIGTAPGSLSGDSADDRSSILYNPVDNDLIHSSLHCP